MAYNRIPVNIISGFLGSGKTTAIIQLLNQKPETEQWAVIINEFGKISIDSQTVQGSFSEEGSVFEISGGCICCSAKGYFHENLDAILGLGIYSRILIEPSGLGGIEMVSEIVGAKPALELMPVICMVDIQFIGNPRLQQLPVYRTQILKADVILFSKCDLLENTALQEELIEQFASLFPGKQYRAPASDPRLLQALLTKSYTETTEQHKYRMFSVANRDLTDDHFHESTYQFEKTALFDPDQLIRILKDHPNLLRAKGHILTKNGWRLLNFTLTGFSFDPCKPKTQSELIVITQKSAADSLERLPDEICKAIR